MGQPCEICDQPVVHPDRKHAICLDCIVDLLIKAGIVLKLKNGHFQAVPTKQVRYVIEFPPSPMCQGTTTKETRTGPTKEELAKIYGLKLANYVGIPIKPDLGKCHCGRRANWYCQDHGCTCWKHRCKEAIHR
jgi:hypothetical protein